VLPLERNEHCRRSASRHDMPAEGLGALQKVRVVWVSLFGVEQPESAAQIPKQAEKTTDCVDCRQPSISFVGGHLARPEKHHIEALLIDSIACTPVEQGALFDHQAACHTERLRGPLEPVSQAAAPLGLNTCRGDQQDPDRKVWQGFEDRALCRELHHSRAHPSVAAHHFHPSPNRDYMGIFGAPPQAPWNGAPGAQPVRRPGDG